MNDAQTLLIMFTTENLITPSAYRIFDADVHLHESGSPSLPPATAPVNIIKEDQIAYAHFVWKQDGWLLPLLSPGCKYECRIYIEQMGAGEVSDPTPVNVGFLPVKNQNFHAVVPIAGLKEGAYKLIGTLLFRGPNGSITPLASYEELGVLQVYKG